MQHTAQARPFQHHSCSRSRVIDFQHLRRAGEGLHYFADNALRGNYGHVSSYAVVGTFVDVEHARALAAAGPNHLRRHSLRNEFLLKCEQRLQTARLPSVLGKTDLLEAQAVKLAEVVRTFKLEAS